MAAASSIKTRFANLALSILGDSTVISDLDTANSSAATVIRLHLPSAFQSALLAYDWSFATGFTDDAMEVLRECPSSGYAYAYRMPANALRIRQLAPAGSFVHNVDQYVEDFIPYKIVNNQGLQEVHTDLKDAFAEYTVDLSLDGIYPDSFARIAAATLALDIAPGVITNNFAKVQNRVMGNIMIWKNQAIAEDKLNESPKMRPVSPFIRRRFEGGLANNPYLYNGREQLTLR